ncbi:MULTISPECIES: hypothetical protein [unclassified Streptomyces]|uniref:hypothetical protein n=1 Tax=unclassified Streptomyces TaxID=2593676 RepID=UPI0033E8D1E4
MRLGRAATTAAGQRDPADTGRGLPAGEAAGAAAMAPEETRTISFRPPPSTGALQATPSFGLLPSTSVPSTS